MKVPIKWVIFGLLLTLSFSNYAAPKSISMCTEHWPPFVIVEKGKPITQGSWVVLLNHMFDDLPNYTLALKITPWKRCLLQIENGLIDGTFSHFKKPDREVYMDFTEPVILDRSVVWYSTDTIENELIWSSYRDLMPYTMGVIQGENYSGELDRLIKNNSFTIQTVTTDTQNFKKLARGRIDIIIKNERVGMALVNELKLNKDIKAAKKPAYAKNRYLSFTKKKDHWPLIKLLNSKIEKMKSTGEIRKILGYRSIQ